MLSTAVFRYFCSFTPKYGGKKFIPPPNKNHKEIPDKNGTIALKCNLNKNRLSQTSKSKPATLIITSFIKNKLPTFPVISKANSLGEPKLSHSPSSVLPSFRPVSKNERHNIIPPCSYYKHKLFMPSATIFLFSIIQQN